MASRKFSSPISKMNDQEFRPKIKENFESHDSYVDNDASLKLM